MQRTWWQALLEAAGCFSCACDGASLVCMCRLENDMHGTLHSAVLGMVCNVLCAMDS